MEICPICKIGKELTTYLIKEEQLVCEECGQRQYKCLSCKFFSCALQTNKDNIPPQVVKKAIINGAMFQSIQNNEELIKHYCIEGKCPCVIAIKGDISVENISFLRCGRAVIGACNNWQTNLNQ